MPNAQLFTPILDGGVQLTNHFNGRLLTGDDLTVDQGASQSLRDALGIAVGAGVAEGLHVTASTAQTVDVSTGVAVNRSGQVLRLDKPISLSIAADDGTDADVGTFHACGDPIVVSGNGAYVLTLAPVEGYLGRAPMVGIGDSGVAGSCGRRYRVQGACFKIVPLDTTAMFPADPDRRDKTSVALNAIDPTGVQRLRSLLAHACFGSDRLVRVGIDPFARSTTGQGPQAKLGVLDAVLADRPGEVPLAVFHWRTGAIRLLDVFAARRRPTPGHASSAWPRPASPRVWNDAEAMFLQFQTQIESIFRATAGGVSGHVPAASYRAKTLFDYLPPAGMVPLLSGAAPAEFFDGCVAREPAPIDPLRVQHWIRRALACPPIDLASDKPIHLYYVRENATNTQGFVRYVLFTTHLIPPPTARFDADTFDEAVFP